MTDFLALCGLRIGDGMVSFGLSAKEGFVSASSAPPVVEAQTGRAGPSQIAARHRRAPKASVHRPGKK